MGQAGPFLRRMQGGWGHWCPGCGEMHRIPDSWQFNGDQQAPTFSPSVKHTGKQSVIVDGRWTGEWHRGPDGKALDLCCHYFIRSGNIEYCGDCTHGLNGQSMPLPELPEGFRDD